jgi:hypothetical protein
MDQLRARIRWLASTESREARSSLTGRLGKFSSEGGEFGGRGSGVGIFGELATSESISTSVILFNGTLDAGRKLAAAQSTTSEAILSERPQVRGGSKRISAASC